MSTVLLVIHLMIASALVGVVLLQRSEGGALGIGGGGGGGFLTGRGTANLLTRVTAVLALAFFTTSIMLSILAGGAVKQPSLIEAAPPAATTAPADGATGGDAAKTPEAPKGGVLDKIE